MAAVPPRGEALRRRLLLGPRWRRILTVVAVVAVFALVAVGAIVAQGYDVKQTPIRSPFVWAINQATSQYARVNTDVRELDTIASVDSPSDVLQSGDQVVLLTAQDNKFARVDTAEPQDFGKDGDGAKDLKTLAASSTVRIGGEYVAMIASDDRTVSITTLADGTLSTPSRIVPSKEFSSDHPYTANAIAMSASGLLLAYSSATKSVLRFDVTTGKALGEDAVTDAPDGDDLQLTAVGDQWLLYAPASDTGAQPARLWTRSTPTPTPLATDWNDPKLQFASTEGDSAVVATSDALVRVPLTGAVTPQSVPIAVDATHGYTGTVAAYPYEFDGAVYAAWITPQAQSDETTGALWSSTTDSFTALTGAAPAQQTSATPVPTFRANGSELALNDEATGWVWTVPDGRVVPSTQTWSTFVTPNQSASNDNEQRPPNEVAPVATADTFGVRAGALVSLPVLLNDYDSNGDVITVVPGSVTGLDDEFGTAQITSDLGRIAVRVAGDAAAGRSASFGYSITDGTLTASATVRLRVANPASADQAPQWCGTMQPACVTDSPALQVAPGGSGSVPVLNGWVDPEGDAVYVASAAFKDQGDDSAGSVAVTEGGDLYFQSSSTGGSGGTVPVTVTVKDARGAQSQLDVPVVITATPALTADPFSTVTQVGRATVIDPGPHVSNVAGAFRIAGVPTSSDPAGQVAVSAAATTMTFTATKAGSYVIKYDVSDRRSGPVSAIARVTVVDAADAALAAAPITVFVRPHLDSTVDVLTAVTNPSGGLLSLISAQPEDHGRNPLDPEVVDHRLLRVTGSTADGEPGVIGSVSYLVHDEAGRSVTGLATVVLLDGGAPDYPIAVDDAATVRAGAQLDVPVLDNDISSDGYALQLDPTAAALTADFGDGIAFVSGDRLRLLAPAQPGTYTVSYTVYTSGDPSRADTATVTITVVAPGQNTAPRPADLEARVVQGQVVRVPFDSYGVDPDGDRVTLSRIVQQPEHGVASIDAKGGALLYTAIDSTYVGADSFTYEVTDPDGGAGVATVRVGVLSTDSASGPVTLTDYVQAQARDGATVQIDPVANDSDPLGYALEVACIAPDLPGACGTASTAAGGAAVDGDFAASEQKLSALLDWSKGSNSARIRTGVDPGTYVFVYQVVAHGNQYRTAYGYIVLDVVGRAIPDAPVVPDSYVSVEDRATFPTTGVDVLTAATWVTGSVSDLRIESLDAAYEVSGSRIRGALPQQTAIVPFRATAGTGDQTVVTYGFVIVPGQDAVILSLIDPDAHQKVKENSSTTFQIDQLIAVPAGRTLEVGDDISARLRKNAVCSRPSGDYTIEYTAHAGAPWGDGCLVPVRLDGQQFYTDVLVPIDVEPEQAVPYFVDGPNYQVIPDDTTAVTIDLAQFVQWRSVNTEPQNLAFTVTKLDPSVWTMTQKGNTLRIIAAGTAVPDTPAQLTVSFAGKFADVDDHAVIGLTVGQVPNVTPRGGIATNECVAASGGGSCTQQAIGLPGEEDYFSNGGARSLTLSAVRPASDCPGVSFAMRGSTVVASWSGDIDGMTCTTRFQVTDPSADHHVSPPDKYGTITWNFQARPRPVTTAVEYSYRDKHIVFRITPPKRAPVPALTKYIVTGPGGASASCAARGSATVDCDVETRRNLDPQPYSVVAVNDIDSSEAFTTASSWSYPKLSIATATAEPVYDRDTTSRSTGAVKFTIGGFDTATISGFTVDEGGSASQQPASTDPVTFTLPYSVGHHSITVTPYSAPGPPPNALGPREVDAQRTIDVTAAGAPSLSAAGAVTHDTTSVTVTGFRIDTNSSANPQSSIYAAWLYGTATPVCTMNSAGKPAFTGGSGILLSATDATTVPGLQPDHYYYVAGCATNGFGSAGTDPRFFDTNSGSGSGASGSLLYTIDHGALNGDGNNTNGVYQLQIDESQAVPPNPDYHANWTNYDAGSNTASRWTTDPQISVTYCQRGLLGLQICDTGSVTATPTDPHQAWQLAVQGSTSSLTCTAGARLTGFSVVDLRNGQRNVAGSLGTVTVTAARYYNVLGARLPDPPDPADVPSYAARVDGVQAVITWTDGRISALPPYAWSLSGQTCNGTAPLPDPSSPPPTP